MNGFNLLKSNDLKSYLSVLVKAESYNNEVYWFCRKVFKKFEGILKVICDKIFLCGRFFSTILLFVMN